MNRIYAVLANPKGKDSLSGYFFYETVKYLEDRGAHVDVLDLYKRAQDIPFYQHKMDGLAFFEENKKRFMAADKLLLVYPIYWYAVPGIMKCWFDLITSFAWKYQGGFSAQAKHTINKSLIINLSSAPTWYLRYIKGDSATRMVTNTLRWMDINQNSVYRIGRSHRITPNDAKRHLEAIKNKSLFLIDGK